MQSLRFLVVSGLLTALTISPSLTATAEGFVDVQTNADYEMYLTPLQAKGIVSGYKDRTFRAKNLVNRAEFLKAVMTAAYGSNITAENHRCFSDFRGTEQWYWVYACAAKEKGLITGYPDRTFRGWQTITLAEAAKIAVTAANIPLPQYFREPDHWYDPYLDALAGTPVFELIDRTPWKKLTRREMVILIGVVFDGNTSSPNACSGGHVVGDSGYLAPDGCNTCTCTEHGDACTKKACPAPTEKKCMASNQCGTGEICTTELGDCRPACEPGQMCIQVCTGICQKKTANEPVSCRQQERALDRFFTEHLSCKTDSDCDVFVSGCSPYLTCGKPVRKDKLSEAQTLLSTYENACSGTKPEMCAKCVAQAPYCDRGQCALH